jgi:hypothetical protein
MTPVLHGHLEAGERHHARVEGHMAFEERRALERGFHRRDSTADELFSVVEGEPSEDR